MKSLFRNTIPLLGAAFLMLGWGSTGHSYINRHAVEHLPASMQSWKLEKEFFAAHGSDADYRKGSDPTEGPKHYIDLELYANSENLSDDLDSLRAAVGQTTLDKNGILPWATRIAYDSLVAQLRRNDWEKAKLTASDIGHYVGDGHQPLHNTDNYNGQLTGNTGIHSRYETSMINAYQGELTVAPHEVRYIGDVFAFSLANSIAANAWVDSIMIADDSAKALSGWNGSGTPPPSYYEVLWRMTRHFTVDQIQHATEALADLWYSAALDAGTLTDAGRDGGHGTAPSSYGLYQNYPNPFNPTTTIRFRSPADDVTRLTVHDLSGRTVATLMNAELPAGEHQVWFDASELSGGIYLCMFEAGALRSARKMVLLR